MPNITERLKAVKENIAQACERSGRDADSVSTIIVTKTVEFEQIREVVENGYIELGESRTGHLKQVAGEVDEYLKANAGKEELPDAVNWHMIGHLQRNKVKQAMPFVNMIHSVDTLRLAEEVSQAAIKFDKTIRVLLQVNCSGESQKYGVPVGAAIHLADQMMTMPKIKLVGLMTMAALTKEEVVIRKCFIRAREVFEDIRKEIGRDFEHLSMGMSNDYEIAVEEGATILRIGSAIFH